MSSAGQPVSHQTVVLQPGRHRSPKQGVCVMELASMLAGEDFTDRPKSVCPVIGAFLRVYNDCVDKERRQDLYAVASKVVGTRGGKAAVQRRMDLCLQWASSGGDLPWRFKFFPRRPEVVGSFAARAALTRRGRRAHERTLRFVDDLIAAGERRPPVETSTAAVEETGVPV